METRHPALRFEIYCEYCCPCLGTAGNLGTSTGIGGLGQGSTLCAATGTLLHQQTAGTGLLIIISAMIFFM